MKYRICSLVFFLFIIVCLSACNPATAPHSNVDFSAQIIRTDEIVTGAEGEFPDCLVIRSYDALQSYYTEHQSQFQFTQLSRACDPSAADFHTAIVQYSEAWFETHDLLLARVRESKGSVTLQVSTVTHKSDPAQWVVSVKETIPASTSDDMAFWHILIAVDKCECPPHDATVILH